jgi:hypothetical protein
MREWLNAPIGAALAVGAGIVWASVMVAVGSWAGARWHDWWHGRPPHRGTDEASRVERQMAVQRQLWNMERQIREEQMSEEERAWHRRYRERQAAITQEARRRLGLPKEEDDG